MDFDELQRKIRDGEITVTRMGSTVISKNVNPRDVLAALRWSDLARECSEKGRAFAKAGKNDEAASCFLQSLVLEDSLKDLAGMASDMGNLARIYLKQGCWAKAQAGFECAIRIDLSIVQENFGRGLRADEGPPDLTFLRALHLEGLGECRLAQGDAKGSREALREARQLFNSIGDSGAVSRIERLLS